MDRAPPATDDRRSGMREGNGGTTPGNEPVVSPVTPAEDLRTIAINRISWGAVLAGVAIALIAQVLLNLIGVGIGASVLNPATPGTPDASSFSIGAAIWWALSGIIAAFLGGWAAGRLSGKPDHSTAAWHGLTSWAVTTLVMLWLLTTTISSIVGGSLQMLGTVAGQAAQGATQAGSAAVSAVDPLGLIESRLRATQGDRNSQVNLAVTEIRALLLGSSQQAAAQRDRAAQALAAVRNIPIEQARTEVTQLEQQYRELAAQTQRTAAQTATQAAQTASRTVSWSTILAAIALALGALAGWFGGRVGAVDPTITPMQRVRAAIPPNMQQPGWLQ